MSTIRKLNGVWSVRWSNPYTSPPDNKPKFLLRIEVPWGPTDSKETPSEITELADANPGYSIGWDAKSLVPPRRWSEEAKKRNRLNRLRKRIEKKFPLFLDEILEKERER